MAAEGGWLPAGFRAPSRAVVPPHGHLRFLRADDAAVDFAAIDSSRERLWATYGRVWGWPAPDYGLDDTRLSLARHEDASLRGAFFAYGLFDDAERALLATVYVDPPARVGGDADVNWWVAEGERAGAVRSTLDVYVPRWIRASWPFSAPRLIGVDLTWDEWLALPER